MGFVKNAYIDELTRQETEELELLWGVVLESGTEFVGTWSECDHYVRGAHLEDVALIQRMGYQTEIGAL